ncbi:MAG: esterase family protein [Clostridia bacterium]|nr:esterase family protein [Clostridia bacterium]
MAFLEMTFYSKALMQNVPVNILLPERSKKEDGSGAPEGTYKTLWLLHGLSGNHTDWIRKSSIERYASEYGIAVVMPGVGRSWYTDTAYDAGYFTFVTQELPAICRSYFKGMSGRREENLIAGLSMGGYGAVKAALTYPEQYCGCATLSGSLDITRKGRPYSTKEWQGIFGYELRNALELEGSDHDVFALLKKQNGKQLPKIYSWCGTEDTLITVNRQFRDALQELQAEYLYEESEGDHSWKWWDLHIQDALKHLLT